MYMYTRNDADMYRPTVVVPMVLMLERLHCPCVTYLFKLGLGVVEM